MSESGLLDQVTALVERVSKLDFLVPEDTGSFELDADLLRNLEALMDVSQVVMDQVMTAYDEAGDRERAESAAGKDSLRAIGEQISSELAAREIADLAFVGRGQVRGTLEQFRRARDKQNAWIIASRADAAQRHLAKALIALESAMREYHGLAPFKRRVTALEDSLEIRRVYAQFRRAVLRLDAGVDAGDETGGDRSGRAADPQLRRNLRDAGRRIAILRDRAIYPYLRIEDRREIRRFQKNIASWLVQPDRPDQGHELWQDLVAFAELLHRVNNRQELREHDREVIERSLTRLFDAATADGLLPADLVTRLEALLGRDDELDELLHGAQRPAISALRAPLLRLRAELADPEPRPI